MLLEKTTTLKSQYIEEVHAREAVEKSHDERCRVWKAQLDAKAEEFEAIQAQFAAPRDLDLLKLRIQEEIEAPHKHKMHLLEEESQKFRELFYNIRRQHELLKTEYEQYTIDQGKREEAVLGQHKIETASLTDQIAALRRSMDEKGSDDTVTRVRWDLAASEQREAELGEEISGLRREKEAARVEMERSLLQHGRGASEMQARVQGQLAEMQELARKADAADRGMRKVEKDRLLSDKRYADTEAELGRLKKQLESRAVEAAQDAEDVRQRESAGRDQAQRKSEALKEEIDGLKRRLVESEDARRRADTSVESLRQATSQVVEASNTEMTRSLAAKDDDLARAREALHETEEKLAQIELERTELEARADQEDVGLRGELRMQHREKDELEKKYNALHMQNAQRQAEDEATATEHKEVEEELGRLQDRHRELLAREHALTVANEQLGESIKFLEDDVAAVSSEQEQQRAEMIQVRGSWMKGAKRVGG